MPKERRSAWYAHWVEGGLAALERLLEQRALPGPFAYGERPSLADCCLVPQVTNAIRFSCRLDHVPKVSAIFRHCMALPEFAAAAPQSEA